MNIFFLNSCKGCNEVKELWLDRRQWWPDYCFGKVDSNDASVYWKVICAALLFGKGKANRYVIIVLQV